MITDEISIPTTKEIEADGFITPPSALERTDLHRAKPVSECIYPKCEECDKYHGHYCTVPMVVSKQMWLILGDLYKKLMERVDTLENLVTDEILGDKPQDFYVATEEEYESFTPLQKYWYDKGFDEAVRAAEFVDKMKDIKPSIDGKPIEIRKYTPIKKGNE